MKTRYHQLVLYDPAEHPAAQQEREPAEHLPLFDGPARAQERAASPGQRESGEGDERDDAAHPGEACAGPVDTERYTDDVPGYFLYFPSRAQSSAPRGVALDGRALFFPHVHLHGGPAPFRSGATHQSAPRPSFFSAADAEAGRVRVHP